MTEPLKYTSCSNGRQSHFLAEFETKSSVSLAAAIQVTDQLITAPSRVSGAPLRREGGEFGATSSEWDEKSNDTKNQGLVSWLSSKSM